MEVFIKLTRDSVKATRLFFLFFNFNKTTCPREIWYINFYNCTNLKYLEISFNFGKIILGTKMHILHLTCPQTF